MEKLRVWSLGPVGVAAMVGGLSVSTVAIAAEPKDVEAESPAVVFSRVSGAVVMITAATPKGVSQGSGVVVGPELVVTNLHVISGSERISVVTKEGPLVAAVKITSKPSRDLAVLSVPGLKASRVLLRPSAELSVGDRVFAIGNPRGYEQSLTEGLVSALRKEPDGSIVQTSAAISPGSSGGGLFDTRGRLVGITTKTRTDGQSLNFAHPTEWVQDLLEGFGQGDGGVVSEFTVSNRPEALLCQLAEEARWGLFSEGVELLESSPTKGRLLMTGVNTTRPVVAQGRSEQPYVLKDLRRSSQVALFRGAARDDPFVFVAFEETGDVRATLAWVVAEAGEPRLVTRSGVCETGDGATLTVKKTQPAFAPVDAGAPTIDGCEVDGAACFKLAMSVEGGERFLYLKKACRLGHRAACDEGIAMAEGVGDRASMKDLDAVRVALPAFPSSQAPSNGIKPPEGKGAAVAPAPPARPARKPLKVR